MTLYVSEATVIVFVIDVGYPLKWRYFQMQVGLKRAIKRKTFAPRPDMTTRTRYDELFQNARVLSSK